MLVTREIRTQTRRNFGLASYDNAMAESVNAIYKAELVYWETLGRRR